MTWSIKFKTASQISNINILTVITRHTNQKGHFFDVRRSRRHIPAYTRERAAAMFLGSIVREFYYKQYDENRTMIIKTSTAPFGI